jgi:hypothetical protein
MSLAEIVRQKVEFRKIRKMRAEDDHYQFHFFVVIRREVSTNGDRTTKNMNARQTDRTIEHSFLVCFRVEILGSCPSHLLSSRPCKAITTSNHNPNDHRNTIKTEELVEPVFLLLLLFVAIQEYTIEFIDQ